MGLILGIDIGGTFTDVVCYIDVERRALHSTKVPSTPPDLVQGFVRGAQKVLRLAGGRPADVERLIHGTTIATNAILERKGATIGILMTRGFEDVLVIGRQKRSEMYDLDMDPETPTFLAPRRRIRGVPGRLDSSGREIEPLDEEAVRRAVRELRRDHDVQALAVCYLFSFLNPEHERRTAAIVAQEAPGCRVSLSSTVDPKFREYERLCVTAFDAYVRPVIEDYVGRLRSALAALGCDAPLQIMQSRGGVTSAATVLEKTVATVLSGPAAGVIGGTHVGQLAGAPDVITLDIGGTSCDVALVRAGRPLISTEGRVDRYPLRQPMVDVNTIGAGGGSIAWVDAAGGLRVGPQSAGSNPGPACYGWGGTQATVTDASVVLGYLNPDYFAGGELRLDPALARGAVEEAVARPLGMGLLEAASGVHRILNSRMADQLRLVSIRRGYDPRQFALVALGGAGPVHAGRLAQQLGMARVIVPATPGVLSAFGLLVANVEHEHSRTFAVRAAEADAAALAAAFAELDAVCTERMRQDRVPAADVTITRSAEMRYVGQSYEIEVPLASWPLGAAALEATVAAFHAQHDRVYGHHNTSTPVEVVNLRAVHVAPLPKPDARAAVRRAGSAHDALKGERPAYFDEIGRPVPVPIYEKALLPLGAAVTGPAIVEQPDTTTVLYPGQRGAVDAYGNIVITLEHRR